MKEHIYQQDKTNKELVSEIEIVKRAMETKESKQATDQQTHQDYKYKV